MPSIEETSRPCARRWPISPALNLEDSLRIALLVCDHEPEHGQRAAVRWLGRFCLERRGVTLADVRAVLDAFAVLVEEPDGAEATLRRLAHRR